MLLLVFEFWCNNQRAKIETACWTLIRFELFLHLPFQFLFISFHVSSVGKETFKLIVCLFFVASFAQLLTYSQSVDVEKARFTMRKTFIYGESPLPFLEMNRLDLLPLRIIYSAGNASAYIVCFSWIFCCSVHWTSFHIYLFSYLFCAFLHSFIF